MAKTVYKVALLGAGYIADWHFQAIRRIPNAHVVAVCDQNAERAKEFANRCGISRIETDLEAMLKTGGLDAVHILLPPAAHATAASAVLDAGLAAYLEKPLCVQPEEADDLVARSDAGAKLAVGHNFLFDPRYDQLKSDIASGRLGRVEHISVVWAKEFGPAKTGPYGGWVFRNPGNILLEIGPHPIAHLIDLLGGIPDRLQVEALDEVRLPTGAPFYRRWLIWGFRGRMSAEIRLAFGPGFLEHRVEVHGTAGTATVDFDRSTYVLRRPTHMSIDFDRYARTKNEGNHLVRQGRVNLAKYVLSKTGLVREGNAFGTSISRAMNCFYSSLPNVSDLRLSPRFGADVVRTCRAIAQHAGIDLTQQFFAKSPVGDSDRSSDRADVLVLGATGFIGRAVVRQLAKSGRQVRVMVRDPAGFAAVQQDANIDVRSGDLQRRADLEKAIAGAQTVIHLARSQQARTWHDYQRQEIDVTRMVGEVCLDAGVKRLIYTGTTDGYYNGREETITETTPLDPQIYCRNLYAQAKAESERILFELHRTRGLPVVVMRPAIVIGSGGDPHHWGVGIWPSASTCQFWGPGDHPIPFVLVSDVADAIVRAVDREGVVGEIFNLCGGPCLTPREYVDALSVSSGMWIDARPTPTWRYFVNDVAKWMVKVLVRHPDRRLPSYRDWKSRSYVTTYDCSKAKRVLGWNPVSDKETMIAEGVRSAVVH